MYLIEIWKSKSKTLRIYDLIQQQQQQHKKSHYFHEFSFAIKYGATEFSTFLEQMVDKMYLIQVQSLSMEKRK